MHSLIQFGIKGQFGEKSQTETSLVIPRCLVKWCSLFQLHPEAPGGESVLHVTGGPDGRGQSNGGDM